MLLSHNLKSRLFFYGLVFFVCTLPFQRILPPTYGLSVLFASFLVQFPWKQPRSNRKWRFFAVQMGFVSLLIIGVFWSPDQSSAWREFGRMLPLFFGPLILAFGPAIDQKRIHRVLFYFVFAVVLSTFLGLLIGVYNYLDHRELGDLVSPLNYLFYTKLSYFLEHQASYYSLYVLTALVIALPGGWSRTGWESPIFEKIQRTLSLFLGLVLFLLAARTQLAILFLLVPIYLILNRSKSYQGSKVGLVAVFVVGALFSALLIPKVTRQRIQQLGDEAAQTWTSNEEDAINNRWYIWGLSYELWKERPLFGWGTDAAENKLVEKAGATLANASTVFTAREVLNSDLIHKDVFLSDFYLSNPVEEAIILDGSNTSINKEWVSEKSFVEWTGRTLHLFADSGMHVGIHYEGLIPGNLYRFQFKAYNRLNGGMALFNESERLIFLREEAEDGGVLKKGSFQATSHSLFLNTAKYIPSDIYISDFQLFDYGPLTRNVSKTIPGRLQNALNVYKNHFNAHSQYAQVAIDYGLVGLIIFLIPFFWLLRLGWKSKNWLQLAIALALLVSLGTEHMLQREAGLFFIAFVLPFAYYYLGNDLDANLEDKRDELDLKSK